MFAIGLALTMMLAGERLWPAEIRAVGWKRLARNLLLGAIAVLMGPLILLLQSRLWGGIDPLADTSGWQGGLVAQLLVFDLWVYATHRAYHLLPWAWALHAPHHLDEALDVSSSLRFHPGEIIVSGLLRVIPCLAVGIGPATLALFETMLIISAAFHHSNIGLPGWLERPLSWLIVTPSIHWVHHHNRRADTDSNYSALLSIWDRLFGTRSDTARFHGMSLGIEAESERTLGGLLVYPVASISRKI